MPDPIKVLLIASDAFADDQAPLRIDREARAVMNAIQRACQRETIKLETRWAVTIEEFQHLIIDFKPAIVHFAGHGNRKEGIFLTDYLGNDRAIDREALCELFGILRKFVRVVVLNACETLSTAREIGSAVDYTIGMRTSITDAAAAAFAEEFYGSLASGMTVKEAFDLGRCRLRVSHPRERRTPQLLIRSGVDPDSWAAEHGVGGDEGPATARAVHWARLLFDVSTAGCGEQVRLMAEKAARHRSSHGREWLLGLFSYAKGPAGIASPHARDRFAMLLRAFYANPRLAPEADAALGELLRAGAGMEVLELVQRLRSAVEFDAYHWLRRIVDEGGEPGAAVRTVLDDDLMHAGSGIYRLLEKLSEWLPPAGHGGLNISESNRIALELLPEYAAATIAAWDHAGDTGSRRLVPLLVMDADDAQPNAALLASWLLHPALPAIYGGGDEGADGVTCTVAGLVAKWACILGAPDGDPPVGAAADDVLTALLEAILAQTSDARGLQLRRAMVAYWTEMKMGYAALVRLLGFWGGAKRREVARDRDLLQALLDRFRELENDPPPAMRFVA